LICAPSDAKKRGRLPGGPATAPHLRVAAKVAFFADDQYGDQ